MQPYQEASEKVREQIDKPSQLLKKGANLALKAGSAYAGGTIASKVLPFLSEFIPPELAIKGLTKINPKLGEFIDKGLKNGFSFDEIKNTISEKLQKAEEQTKAKSMFEELLGNVEIEQLPENVQNQLGFLKTVSDQLEKKGTPRESPTFKRLAKKIKDVLSGKVGDLQSEAMGQPMQQSQPMQFNQEGQNIGPGQQALMSMLQQINQKLGA